MASLDSNPSVTETNNMVFLWCVPRSLSTVLTKCLSFVDDIQVWFEPYVVCYENSTIRNPEFLFGDPKMTLYREQHILGKLRLEENTNWIDTSSAWSEEENFKYSWVKKQLEDYEPQKKNVFVKTMTYAVDGIPTEKYLPAVDAKHSFLIRNPLSVFPSFKRAIENEFDDAYLKHERNDISIIDDIPIYKPKQFYRQLFRKWEEIHQKEGKCPIVIDADDLIDNTEATLQKYCEAVGFQWDEKLLSWDNSCDVIQHWKGSADYLRTAPSFLWFKNALHSNQFFSKSNKMSNIEDLSPDVQECIYESLPYYNELKKHKI